MIGGRALSRRACGTLGIGMRMLEPIVLPMVLKLLSAQSTHASEAADECPGTCPSSNAQLCTYGRWFAQPAHKRQLLIISQQPSSARCIRTLLRSRVGCHGLVNDWDAALRFLHRYFDMHTIGASAMSSMSALLCNAYCIENSRIVWGCSHHHVAGHHASWDHHYAVLCSDSCK